MRSVLDDWSRRCGGRGPGDSGTDLPFCNQESMIPSPRSTFTWPLFSGCSESSQSCLCVTSQRKMSFTWLPDLCCVLEAMLAFLTGLRFQVLVFTDRTQTVDLTSQRPAQDRCASLSQPLTLMALDSGLPGLLLYQPFLSSLLWGIYHMMPQHFLFKVKVAFMIIQTQ